MVWKPPNVWHHSCQLHHGDAHLHLIQAWLWLSCSSLSTSLQKCQKYSIIAHWFCRSDWVSKLSPQAVKKSEIFQRLSELNCSTHVCNMLAEMRLWIECTALRSGQFLWRTPNMIAQFCVSISISFLAPERFQCLTKAQDETWRTAHSPCRVKQSCGA